MADQDKTVADTVEEIGGTLADANDRIAQTVVGGYETIEHGVVGTYKKIENAFVDTFLRHGDETVEQAKERLAREREEREANSSTRKAVQNARAVAGRPGGADDAGEGGGAF